jgi:hypothetical protein
MGDFAELDQAKDFSLARETSCGLLNKNTLAVLGSLLYLAHDVLQGDDQAGRERQHQYIKAFPIHTRKKEERR